MCGFVGVKIRQDLKEWREDLRIATSSLTHRGPDDFDLFVDNKRGVGLGHRRLSIIDLSSAARQPMASDDGRFVLVYNGELYNFREIRGYLEKKGYQFRSSSDSEVVLKAFMEWGTDAFEKFTGMFAFVIWDNQRERFFLVRDRLGIKPLYYYIRGKTILFASELKALMAFRGFVKELDLASVQQFLHYQYIPSPHTIFKYTFKLLPGHWAVIEDDHLKMYRYWKPPIKPSHFDENDFSEDNAEKVLERILTKSVEARLISDVPLGALLSGGIDSSLIVALMQKVSVTPIRTFSIGFDEPGYDEAPWAAEIARHLGTDHTELYATQAQAMEIIPCLPEIYDEPFADSSAIPTVLVSRLARSEVTVALSGDGGDEQFAGYPRYQAAWTMTRASRLLPGLFWKHLSAVLKRIPTDHAEKTYSICRKTLPGCFEIENFRDKWQKVLGLLVHADDMLEAYRSTICVWSEKELRMLVGQELLETRFEETFRETQDLSPQERFMMIDMGTYLPDDLLTKVDRASMSASLEVRVPLLDHRVVEYTSQMPETLKWRKGKSKYLLRRILAHFVPEGLFERPKMGFGVPINKWLREDLRPLLLDCLSPERLRKEGLLDHRLVEQKIGEHLSGRADHQHRLWSLL
ncbi:MAG: asparagine synthase (glutamine-hydrolyzing), partial [Desulfobacteraceae bacterium 4484_190.1]